MPRKKKVYTSDLLEHWQEASNYLGKDFSDCYEVLSLPYDYDTLQDSNFEAAKSRFKAAGLKEGKDYTVAGFNSPGGSFDLLFVYETSKKGVEVAEQIVRDMADYPCLDEEDYSWREYERHVKEAEEEAEQAQREKEQAEAEAAEERLKTLYSLPLNERLAMLEAERMAEQEAKDKAEMEKFSHLQIPLFD